MGGGASKKKKEQQEFIGKAAKLHDQALDLHKQKR